MKKPIKLWKHHAIFEIVHLEAGVLKGQFPKEFSKKVTAPRPCDRSAAKGKAGPLADPGPHWDPWFF